MARVRIRSNTAASPAPQLVGADRAASTERLGDVSRLLRARSFWIDGETPAAQRVRSNLQSGPARIDREAEAWISTGRLPSDRVGIALAEGSGLLGPNSFGFLNNVDGIAPLSAPLAERPRLGRVALVVPRRDALPELAPLLSSRLLGVSWLVSVGDGDPAEVLQFLQHDPATGGLLVALGKGARPSSLLDSLVGKPAVVLLSPSQRDSALLRAVSRRALAKVTSSFEEWLAHGALLDAGFPSQLSRPAMRRDKTSGRPASVIVLGAGADLVQRELSALHWPPPLRVDADDADAVARTLAKAAEQADLLILCGSRDQLADVRPARAAILLEPSERDRLRALLLAIQSVTTPTLPHTPVVVRPLRDRLETVLADLPPPLYVAGEVVSREPLGDHDVKRLLAAYGVRVSRQAPVNSTTSALRVVGKLGTPVWVLPGLLPMDDVSKLAAAEARDGVLCQTQAEVKRQTAQLLERCECVLLREVPPKGPSLRVQAVSERGVGLTLRVSPVGDETGSEACLLPLLSDEAQAVARSFVPDEDASQLASLAQLLGQIAVCFESQKIEGDLLIRLADEPLVVQAAGVLLRG